MPAGEPERFGEGLLIQVTGMGAERARRGAERLLALGATALASWGSAGGLTRDLHPGDLVLPKSVLSKDNTVYPVDAIWHGRLCERLQGELCIHVDALVESPTVLRTAADKSALYRTSGAVAVDLESAAVAEAAEGAGVSLMVVRAVVDAADVTIPNCVIAAVNQDGHIQRMKLLAGLARRPGQLFALIGLGKCFRAAEATLIRVTRLAGPSLLYA